MDDENAAFWLPTHFLTDDDFVSEKSHPTTAMKDQQNHKFYDYFSNSVFGSDPFDSPVSSTDNDENTEDDASLLSHLARHLAQTSLRDFQNKNSTSERPWVFSTSPQSTLSGFGGGWSNGPSRVPSPPLTPELKDDAAAWDLLYEAAGQVARLKMNALAAQMNRGLLTSPRHTCGFSPSSHNSSHFNLYNNHQQRRSCGGALGLPQSAWPPLGAVDPHHQRRTTCGPQMRGIYRGGTGNVGPTTVGGVKRQSVGTGVFIPQRATSSPPRHHHNHQPLYSELRRKPTVVIPTRVAQSLNMGHEEANLKINSGFSGAGFPTDHELMMARRNAILGQQRRNHTAAAMVGPGHEIRLPNDWTY